LNDVDLNSYFIFIDLEYLQRCKINESLIIIKLKLYEIYHIANYLPSFIILNTFEYYDHFVLEVSDRNLISNRVIIINFI
jgi:hypothetical protein